MNQRDDHSLELISAYVDGELTPDERARVEQLVASNDVCRQALADMRSVSGGMRLLPQYHLERAFTERVIAAARDLGAALHDDPPCAASAPPVVPASHAVHWPAAVAFLATVAAVAIAAVLFWGPGDHTTRHGLSDQRISQAVPRDGQAASGEAVGPGVRAPGNTSGTESVAQATDPSIRPETVAQNQVESAVAASEPSESAVRSLATPPSDGRSLPESASGPQGPPRPVPDATIGGAAAPMMADLPPPGEPRPGEARPDISEVERSMQDVATPSFSGAQQLLFVIDVALTQQGLEKGAFEQMLAAKGVPIEGTVPVDTKLEAVLMASRFFEPVQAAEEHVAASDAPLSLIYVRTPAGSVDELWRGMRANHGDFSSITLDMAILADELAIFQDLRRAVDLQFVDSPAAAERHVRRTAAHRLALSPNWRGTPVARVRGVEGLAGMVPDWMPGKDTRQEQPIEGIPGQPTPKFPLPPGGRLGENVDAELLFVVHVGRVQRDK